VPLANPVEEAQRIAQATSEAGIPLKFTGGVGIALCSPSASRPPLQRAYQDLDAVVPSRQARAVGKLLMQLDYVEDEQFNAVHGGERLIFFDPHNARHVDLFFERIQLCHKLDLRGRLSVEGPALAPADLLLMKLQVVEANRKDLTDICALASDHMFEPGGEGVDLGYLTRLTSDDWGLWRTTTMIAQRVIDFAKSFAELPNATLVVERLQAFVDASVEAPKSRGWKLRARVGDRMRWYELPEEKD